MGSKHIIMAKEVFCNIANGENIKIAKEGRVEPWSSEQKIAQRMSGAKQVAQVQHVGNRAQRKECEGYTVSARPPALPSEGPALSFWGVWRHGS